MKNAIFSALLLAFSVSKMWAQTASQTVRGTVIDRDSRQPLVGATVVVDGSEPKIGAATDENGAFVLQNVPVGRRKISAAYVGFEPFSTDNLIVNSAKEVVLNIEMLETVGSTGQNAVVVSARKTGNEPVNELAVVSARSFSVDETQRYAASANDPGRMAMGFPGVQPSRDSRSDIIIRGNSAVGLAWRLEGIDIPNPNHFARRGTSGGGITIFSTALLGQSDFSTGAFPAEYGNATAGVMDIHFRKGNAERREWTAKAGMLGLDLATEGPLKKGSRASYLVNYRYSTLGILNKMGLHLVGPRTDNTFQDLSFNLNLPLKNNRHVFTFWGIGGLSEEFFKAEEQAKWKSFDDWRQYNFETKMGALGATHTVLLGESAFLKTSFAAMSQSIFVQDDTLDANLAASAYNKEDYLEGRFSLSSVLNKKFSARMALKIGASLSSVFYDLRRDFETGQFAKTIDGKGRALLFEPFASLRVRPSEKLAMSVGVHVVNFSINSASRSIEPRFGARLQMNRRNALTFGYGLHSKVLPIGTYFLIEKIAVPAANQILTVRSNADLPLMRAHHAVMGYDFRFGKGFRLRPELYFQYLFDVPVAKNADDTWSMLNTISGFPDRALVSTGIGQNYGLDLSVEKSFEKGAFLIVSGSLFRSRYRKTATTLQNPEFPTAFDSGLAATLMAGKEWDFSKNSTLQLGAKVLFNGGQRLTPLRSDFVPSRYNSEPPLDYSKAFSEKTEPYFRPDVRVAWRKNRAKRAWTLALDVQNVINRQNIDAISRAYDPDRNAWVFRKQSGLTPLLSWQMDF